MLYHNQLKHNDAITRLAGTFPRRVEMGRAYLHAVSLHLGLLGLRAHWPLGSVDDGGDAFDVSGQGRTFTYTGNPTYGYRGVIPIIQFDGTGDYLIRTDEAALDITGGETQIDAAYRGLTMGCWVLFDNAAGTEEGVFGKSDPPNRVCYEIYRNTSGNLVFRISDTGSTGSVFEATDSTVTAAGSWYHVVGRFDPSTEVAIFVNGSKTANTTTIPATINSDISDLVLGARDGNSDHMTGDVALPFLCGAYNKDGICQLLYHETRALFGVMEEL